MMIYDSPGGSIDSTSYKLLRSLLMCVWYEGLLRMLSLVLLGRPLQHPGAPRPKAASLPSSTSSQNLPELPDVATITLALRTLGSFDFEGIWCLESW